MTTDTMTPEPQMLPVTQQQAQAWYGLAERKNQLAYALQKRELAAQQILLRVEGADVSYEAIDVALAEYRKAFSEMTIERKQFTGLIDDNIIQPLMAFEKRTDPKSNEKYFLLADKSLQLRKAEKEKADRLNAIHQEVAQFRIHVENEFLRVSSIYESNLRKLITQAYEEWMKAGFEKPDYEGLEKVLREVKVLPVNKFTPNYLTVEQMTEIFYECPKPNYDDKLDGALFIMRKTFENWDNDRANAQEAIKHQQEQEAIREMEEKRKADEEAALNTLIHTAEAVQVEEPKIKRNMQIVIVESEQWAKAVMAAFITNLPHLAKYIRVKSWSKLNIGQMATYLGQYATATGDVKFAGLNLEEIEK